MKKLRIVSALHTHTFFLQINANHSHLFAIVHPSFLHRGDAMQTLSISSSRPRLSLGNRAAAMPASTAEISIAEVAPVASDVGVSIDSVSLLRGGKRVPIAHNGSVYWLQATKQ